ncbi:MAG: CPBP family intramembrane glutamic endopeptidase [Candidatus Sulfotelmatobacter sp.]
MPRPQPGLTRDLLELILGYGLIVGILWTPEPIQRILSPVALAATFLVVVVGRRSRNSSAGDPQRDDLLEPDPLGFGWRGLIPSLWILPAAVALAALSLFVAAKVGALHSLYKGNFRHITGYLLWTTYQQFLLQDYFMPRVLRLLSSERLSIKLLFRKRVRTNPVSSEAAAVGVTAVLFSLAHIPNLVLTAATLVWGAVSCTLFRRYHNLYALGVAQCLLGLCFAVCVPDSLNHHLRVGLGYLRYHPTGSAQ